jgi:sigma-B regulation protein RsbU (phosphoserine phosphatase)
LYESTPHPGAARGGATGHNSAWENGQPNTEYDSSVSGRYEAAGVNVEVSKSAKVVMHEVRQRAVVRLLAIASGTVLVALIANVVILRLVNRPLARLIAAVREIAAGKLGLTPGRFQTAEFDFLAKEIGQMSLSLAAVEKDRRAQLAKARQLQEHLSPSPDKLVGLEFVAVYMPADNIAGDYYDALPLTPSHDDGPVFMLCLADVCGHGIPAAMGAAMLKTLLLDAFEKTSDPAAVLGHMNRRFAEVSLPGDFASMFLALVRPGRGELAYASAGHEYGYLVGLDGRLCPLPATGILIGIEPQWPWETSRLPVRAGDRLLLVSDGVTEAVDAQNRQFGRERLAELLQSAPVNTDGLLRAVQNALLEHTGGTPLRDDVTIVVVGLDGVSAPVAAPAGDSPASVAACAPTPFQ